MGRQASNEVEAMTKPPCDLVRRCAECGTLIRECMGFVYAGDFIKAIEAISSGEAPMPPRELCGVCGAKRLD